MSSNPGLPPGNSRYRILNRLGSGGMGDVYSALDETLQRRVALKALLANRRLNAESRDRFLREARILSQLDHPNICRAFDYVQGSATDSTDWLVMELVEGRSLSDMLKAGPITARLLELAEQIAGVLVVTHAAGIVHRDLKPGNVMVTHTGDAKVLDFGIARSGDPRLPSDAAASARAEAATSSSLHADDPDATREAFASPTITFETAGSAPDDASDETRLAPKRSSTVGTLPYMSPEQARGQTAISASDIFSFGLLLQEMLTGHAAYPRKLPAHELLARVQAGQTEPIADTGDFATLIRRMLSTAPTQRPTAVDVVERLRWIRETPKRRLRRGLAGAAVLAMALAATKYTIDLRRERTIAVAAEADANRRQGQAENLIGFMLGDLRGKLEKAGRLDLLDSVDGKATEYFGAVPASSLTGEELSRRAQAIYQIGLVRQMKGNLKGARAAFDESLAIAGAVAARDPNNSDWQLRLATAHFYAGDIRRRENDLTGAMTEFVAYRDIAVALSKKEPANQTFALEAAFGYGGVAAVQEQQGDLAGAKTALESALAVKEKLAAADPKTTTRQTDLASGHNRLGAVLGKLGETAAALDHFDKDLSIRRALVAAEPTNQTLKRPLFTAIAFLAQANETAGDFKTALARYRDGFEVIDPLAASDRANVNWQRDLGVVQREMGDVLRATGHAGDAAAMYQRARAILAPIAAAGPTDIAWQRDLAFVDLGTGTLAAARNDFAAARTAAASIDRVLTPLLAKGADVEATTLLAESRLLAADVAERSGNKSAARELLESALALTRPAAGARSNRMRADEARALAALGQRDLARTIVTELEQVGYRHWVVDDARRRIA